MASVFNIPVGGDTTKLEKDIQAAANRLRKPISIKIDDKGSTALGNITGKATKFNEALDAATARVVAFGAAAGAFNLVKRGVEELLRSTVEVESSIARINVNLNESNEGIKQFTKNVFEAARATGQTFETAAKAAEELARQGLSASETSKRLRDSLILSRLAAIDSKEAVDTLTASINSFSKEALSSTEILNKLAAVDAKFAVSTNDLAQAVSRVGSSASEAGVDFNQLLAIVTSVQQTTARGGAVIGNALKTIFTRVERPKVLDDLESLGIGVRDIQGNALPAIQILKNLATTYDTLSQSQRALVAEQVGGVFQINILKAALGDLGKEYSTYDRALATASGASDEALRKNEALNKTLSASFNEVRQSFTQLFADFGKINLSPILKTITDGLSGVAKFLSNSDIGSNAGKSIGENIVQGIGNVLTGPGVVALAAIVQSVISTLARKVGTEFGQALSSSLLSSGALTGLGQAGKISQTRASIPRAAGGLLPSIIGESAAIKSGVGGASPSAKPVVIPNFNFGGGKTGPVVANTDEYMVPNYANGGSAIFNKDMVSKFGLPGNARRLAQGYIPNFAIKGAKISDVVGSIRRLENENGSYVNYFFEKGSKKIDLDYMKSNKKGDAFELFNALGKRAKRAGLPVYTGVLEPQNRQIEKDASNYDNLVEIFPQLRYRDQRGVKTKGLLSIDAGGGLGSYDEKTFRSLSGLKAFVNSIPRGDFIKKLVNDKIGFSDIETSFAKGYVPNFATSQADYFRSFFGLNQAISREKAAGVPSSSIYVDSDKRVASASNPLGLLVANRRDEPAGGYQGINRAINEGSNPMTHGMARGYVPNFASFGPDRPDRFTRQEFTERGLFIDKSTLTSLNSLFNTLNKVNGKALESALGKIVDIEREIRGQSSSAANLITGRRLGFVKYRKNVQSAFNGEPIPFEDPISGNRGGNIDDGGYAAAFERNSELSARSRDAKRAIRAGNFSNFARKSIGTIEAGGFIPEKEIERLRNRAAASVRRSDEFKGLSRKDIEGDINLRTLFRRRLGDIVDPIEDRNQFNRSTEAQRRLDSRKQRNQNRLLGLSLVSSFAAPTIENGINTLFGSSQGGTLGGIAGGAAGGALQGAGVGAVFGPIGAGVGAVLGGLVGVFSKLEKSAEEFGEELSKATVVQSRSIDSFQQYLQTRQQLDDANKNGAPEAVKERLNSQLATQFAGIDAQTAATLKGLSDTDAQRLFFKKQSQLEARQTSDKERFDVFGLAGTGGSRLLRFAVNDKENPFAGYFASREKNAENIGRSLGTNLANRSSFSSVSNTDRRSLISFLGNDEARYSSSNRNTLQSIINKLAETNDAFKNIDVLTGNFDELNIAVNEAITTARTRNALDKSNVKQEKEREAYFSRIGVIVSKLNSDFQVSEISKQGLQERRGAFLDTRLSLLQGTSTPSQFSQIKLQSQLEEANLQRNSGRDSLIGQFKQTLRDALNDSGKNLGKAGEETIAGNNIGDLIKLFTKQVPEKAKKAISDFNEALEKNEEIARQAALTIRQRNDLESAFNNIQRKRTAFLSGPTLSGSDSLDSLTSLNKLIRSGNGDFNLRRLQKNEALLGFAGEIKGNNSEALTSEFKSLVGTTEVQKQRDSAKNFAANVLAAVFENNEAFRPQGGGVFGKSFEGKDDFYERALKTGIQNTSGENRTLLKEALAQLLDQSGRKTPEDDTKELFRIQTELQKQQQENIDKLGKTKITIDTIVNGTINVVSEALSEGQIEATKQLINEAVAGVLKRVADGEANAKGTPNPPTTLSHTLPGSKPKSHLIPNSLGNTKNGA